MKKNICFIISIILFLSLTFVSCFAFFVPDIKEIGKEPEIISIEPAYLIPGQKAKMSGNNFIAFPKSANKLWINNHPVRVISASNDLIEFIVPKLPLGKAKIKFFVYYLGYKSNETIYPQKESEFMQVTFPAPIIQSTNTLSVKPNMSLLVYGQFSTKKVLIFKIGEEEVKADVISNNVSQLTLPKILPKGLFKIKCFYRRNYASKDKNHLDSSLSNSIILFNDELGSPQLIKLELPQESFKSLREPFTYTVGLYFKSSEKVDITEYTEVKLSGEEIFELNVKNKTIKPIKNGTAKITAKFIWLPINLNLLTRWIY